MGVFDRSYRFAVVTQAQHPFKHTLSDFAYTNPALPGVTNINSAFNYLVSVLYPNVKPAVDTPADLPSSGNTINDYRVVTDDGDGKQAAYRWEQREGDVAAKWYKVADMDWSSESILAQLTDVTQPLYLYKAGTSDLDEDGDVITGTYAGQTVFGGNSANQNLTFNANSGDGTGADTGFVQIDSNFRPVLDDTYDLSTVTERWQNAFFSNSVVVGTTTYGSAGLTDSTGEYSFGDENLTTSGNIDGGVLTGTQLVADDTSDTMALAPGSITDSTGTIDFGAANLTTTGTLRGGASILTGSSETLTFNPNTSSVSEILSSLGEISFGASNITSTGNLSIGEITSTLAAVDNIQLDGNTISSENSNGDIILLPNGTGVINLQKTLQALAAAFTGTVGVTGQLNADNLRLDGNTLSSTDSNGNILIDPDGTGFIEFYSNVLPDSDDSYDLGSTSRRFQDFYLNGGLRDGTNTIDISEILALRSTLYRDVARTIPAQTGDALFYDATNGVWLASVADTEISHNTLGGVATGDAGHTQFAMLAGRSGGQTIIGGTGASEDLVLESTSNATKGNVTFSSNFIPTTSASFSGSWSGIDLGGSSNFINDVYSRGEFKGFRFENVLASSLPSFSAQTPGRMYYATDNGKAYVDTGSSLNVLGVAKYSQDRTFDGIVTQLDTDVSASISDAREAQWQLLDNSNDYEVMGVTIKITSSSNVRVITNSPLPAGSYRLIGVE